VRSYLLGLDALVDHLREAKATRAPRRR